MICAKSGELLAEPIQTVMRKHKISGAYEKLKDLTRGKRRDYKRAVHKLIKGLIFRRLKKTDF